MRCVALCALFAATLATAQSPGQFPTGRSFVVKPAATGKRMMVTSAHPLATAAGLDMLERGGSAVDAAIAVQLVLGLVEPQSSGIGGGAFLMHFDARRNLVAAYDGRETAPSSADERLFQDPSGKPLPFGVAVVGGRSVGVPGVLRMAEFAHQRHGKLPWRALFGPAIRLAERGFPIGLQLHRWLGADPRLRADHNAAALFYNDDGTPKAAGTLVRNPAYAQVLRAVARHGPERFYSGANALAIVAAVRAHAANPGHLLLKDLAGYTPKPREPLCFDYRAHVICSMPPPSSGGIALAQMLGMLEHTGFDRAAPMSADAVHLFAEAGKRAFADRNLYVADPDFVAVPRGLTDRDYLAQRARGIGPVASAAAQAGQPPGTTLSLAPDRSPELPSTSHLSIVDARGNAVSMTTTIETVFGAHLMVNGYLLNNQLTDFSFIATENGRAVANRVEAGKRPRSSMTPVLVFERRPDGTRGPLVLISGSPGGSAIINYVAKTLVASLDWKLPLQEVLSLPNFGSRNIGPNGTLELEAGHAAPALVERLRAMGHEVRELDLASGVHAIERVCRDAGARLLRHCVWIGAADPRREGQAAGR